MKSVEFGSFRFPVLPRLARERRVLAFAASFAALSLGVVSTGWARFGSPIAVPIDRVIANVQARLSENPEDIDAMYTLARAHYLAFINKSASVPAGWIGDTDSGGGHWAIPPRSRSEPGPGFMRNATIRGRAIELALEEMGLPLWSDVPDERSREFQQLVAQHSLALREQDWQPEPIPPDRLLGHVHAALDAFEAVIERRQDNGLYRLGLASLYDQYVQYRETAQPPESLRLQGIEPEQALDVYYEAYELAVGADRSRESLPVAGVRDLVTYEAGTRYLELAADLIPDPTVEQRRRQEQIRDDLDALERLPQRAITPLVLSFRPVENLGKLIDDAAAVHFDLDGNDRIETWTWVRPETGILVWDPLRSGEITSGRQLFGNATWWLLFADGYRALDTLDDDRDGSVAGAELDGLAVWFDRNGNGGSEPGEVVPVERLPLKALGTRPDGREGGGARHSRGLVLADGQVLPTWDWIARRVESGPDCGRVCAAAATPQLRDRR